MQEGNRKTSIENFSAQGHDPEILYPSSLSYMFETILKDFKYILAFTWN